MRRRSLCDAKNFIVCLVECEYQRIVEQLTDIGVIACIRTTIADYSLSVQDQLKIETAVAERSVQVCGTEGSREVVDSLHRRGIVIFHIEAGNSLTWYIKCLTSKAFESLKDKFDSGELNRSLETISTVSRKRAPIESCRCFGTTMISTNASRPLIRDTLSDHSNTPVC